MAILPSAGIKGVHNHTQLYYGLLSHVTKSAWQEVNSVRRVYQLWGPVYSPVSLLPETGPVPGGTTAVPRLLSAYSGLSLSPFCRLWSLILSHGSTCTRTAQLTGQQAQRCLLILVLCEVPVSSTFSHALCPALFTPGAVGMGHAAAGGGVKGAAPGLQVTFNQSQIP